MLEFKRKTILGVQADTTEKLAENIFLKIKELVVSPLDDSPFDLNPILHDDFSSDVNSACYSDLEFLELMAHIVNFINENKFKSFLFVLTNYRTPVTIESKTKESMLNLIFLLRQNIPEIACESTLSTLANFSDADLSALLNQFSSKKDTLKLLPKYDINEVKRELKTELENNINFYTMIERYTRALIFKSENKSCFSSNDFGLIAIRNSELLACHGRAVGSRVCQDWVPLVGITSPEIAFSEHQMRLITQLYESYNSETQDYTEHMASAGFGDEMYLSFMFSRLWVFLSEIKESD